jgi:glycosyltransferase involved in cell wall biosynthesis
VRHSDQYTIMMFTSNDVSRVELALAQYNRHPKIVIVDNDSKDGTVELVKSLRPDVIVVTKPNNGYPDSASVSAGIQACETEWVLLTIVSEFPTIETFRQIDEFFISKQSEYYDGIFIYRQSITGGYPTHVNRPLFGKWSLRHAQPNVAFMRISSYAPDLGRIHFECNIRSGWSRIKLLDPKICFLIHVRSHEPHVNIKKLITYASIHAEQVPIKSKALLSSHHLFPLILIGLVVRSIFWVGLRNTFSRIPFETLFYQALYRALVDYFRGRPNMARAK